MTQNTILTTKALEMLNGHEGTVALMLILKCSERTAQRMVQSNHRLLTTWDVLHWMEQRFLCAKTDLLHHAEGTNSN